MHEKKLEPRRRHVEDGTRVAEPDVDEDDAEARRLAAAIVSQPSVNVAPPKALAEALGIQRSMIFAYRKQYAEGGASALRTRKSGPKGGHKLEGKTLEEAKALLEQGASNRAVARELGVTEGAVRLALKQGRLRRREAADAPERLKAPRERTRWFMQDHGVSFREALWATRAGNVFTTHTPVAAGFDSFGPDLIAKYTAYFDFYVRRLAISWPELLGLGRRDPSNLD